MLNDSEKKVSFIFSDILKLDAIPGNANKESFVSSDKKIIAIFKKNGKLYNNVRNLGDTIPIKSLRRAYTGSIRKKDQFLYLKSKNNVKGVFPIKQIKNVWKYTVKDKLIETKLIAYKDRPHEAKYLKIEFNTVIFLIRGIKQLFPTNSFYEKKIDESKRYAEAFKLFKELVPFKIDQIIDLLSTDQIAYSIDQWKQDPLYYDIPFVDTANLTLAKKITKELPIEELKLLIKTLRRKITDTDWETEYDSDTLNRYIQELKFAKKLLRKMKKEKKKEN